MANSMVVGGKAAYKRGGGGGGGWRRGMGPWARRGSGSDDGSDEEYVVGGDEEGESSYDSYSSDASLEAADAEEEEEEEAYDSADEDEMETARGRRPRKESAGSWGKRRTLPPHRRNSSIPFVANQGEEAGTPPVRRSRTRGSAVLAYEEGGEYDEDDDDDEDFAPEEEDDDDEEVARAPVRKTGGVKSKPMRRLRLKRRPMNSDVKGKRKTAPLTKKKRRRIVLSSDDDDFVVKDKISVVAKSRKKKKEKEKDEQEKNVSNGIRKRRRSCVFRSDPSESDSSDFDYPISVDVPRRFGRLVRKPPSSGDLGEKGKGKDVDGFGKPVCGICLSEERKGVIRGLLDCCSHYFCFACIMEWSKVESRCPICKQRFETLSKSARSDAGFSLRTAVIRIPKRDQVYQPSEEEIRGYLDPYANVVCVECQQGGDDNLMLLCDICDSPAHTYCVGLGREVPDGSWYCDVCRLMDPGSSNSQVQQSVVEHGMRNDLFQGNLHGEIDSVITSLCSPPETPRQTVTPCQLPSEGVGQGASNRYPSSLGYHETLSHVPGFTASTVSGRRSIHQRMQTMLSDNSIRWRSEVVARNNVIQLSSTGSDVFSEENRETFGVQQQSLTNEIRERSSRSFLSSRVNISPCIHNEGSNCHMVGAPKEFS